MTKATVRERLAAGPVRGLGAANAVAIEAAKNEQTLDQLVEAASDSRAVVSIRAANALKKVQDAKPELLIAHARKLVRCALDCEELRTRWNLTLVVGALPLKGRERKLGVDLMFEALASNSSFLRAFAMTGLVNFADGDEALRARVRGVVERGVEDESAAVRARARKLIKEL
jgi:HEAT repeat protein